MKKARKFFAMLLCLTLCIVPLPFSVHAHENSGISLLVYTEDVDCPNCGSTHYYVIETSATTYTENIGKANECQGYYYAAVRMHCDDCSYFGTRYNVKYAVSQHPTLIYCTETRGQNEITAWHCPACTYYHN